MENARTGFIKRQIERGIRRESAEHAAESLLRGAPGYTPEQITCAKARRLAERMIAEARAGK